MSSRDRKDAGAAGVVQGDEPTTHVGDTAAHDAADSSDSNARATNTTRVGGTAAHDAANSSNTHAAASGAPGCEPPGETTPTWMKWITRVSLVIGIVALIATIWFVGPRAIIGHLRAIGWFFIVIVALEILSSVFDATAVYYMARGPGHPSWRQTVVAQLAGRGVNSVTPGGNLGEALKIGLLSQRCSPKRIIAAVMYVTLMIVVVSFVVIAVGTAATAFLFDVPDGGVVLLLIGAGLAAAAATGIFLLLRRGMLTTLTGTLARLHLISRERRDRWNKTLAEVDRRLRGQDVEHRRRALVFILMSQTLQKALSFLVAYAAGYTLGPGQFLALISAGVLVGWVSTIIPMGLGISEGGSIALYSMIGAPASLGLASALSRRVNQIVFAAIGFVVLTGDRVGTQIGDRRRRTRSGSIRTTTAPAGAS